jgi:hypothetical protein
LALLIEAYGKGGMVPYLAENYPVQFLNDLLEQTVELRRDPKEREEEWQREESRKWLEENKDHKLVFASNTGETKTVMLKNFIWSDEDDEE